MERQMGKGKCGREGEGMKHWMRCHQWEITEKKDKKLFNLYKYQFHMKHDDVDDYDIVCHWYCKITTGKI